MCVESSTGLCKEDQCLHVPATLHTFPLPACPASLLAETCLGGTGFSVCGGECGGVQLCRAGLASPPHPPAPIPIQARLSGIATHPGIMPGPPLVPARGCPGSLCPPCLLLGAASRQRAPKGGLASHPMPAVSSQE